VEGGLKTFGFAPRSELYVQKGKGGSALNQWEKKKTPERHARGGEPVFWTHQLDLSMRWPTKIKKRGT